MELFKKFTFEAAHSLRCFPLEHPNQNLHGHSYSVTVYLRGEVENNSEWLMDFGIMNDKLERVKGKLDHRFLNDIDGLAIPTLENIAKWLWDRMSDELPNLSKVMVERITCGEGCVYSEEN